MDPAGEETHSVNIAGEMRTSEEDNEISEAASNSICLTETDATSSDTDVNADANHNFHPTNSSIEGARCVTNSEKIIPSEEIRQLDDQRNITSTLEGNLIQDKSTRDSATNEVLIDSHSALSAQEISPEEKQENSTLKPQAAIDPRVTKDEDDDDGDPIPSGTGVVSKECSASELIGWSEILPKWHNKLNQRPNGLVSLVRNGIPEALRGEVWQLLSGSYQCAELMDRYRIFLTQSAPTEQIILRDIHRTYPAHENFRSDAGSSSLLDSLFKVCKAYAVYDDEVGYCQGLSFLVAALLLHMPEEQAFCVFVRIMKHYGLRNLFRNNFDELYLKFYQLERLLEEHMPDLHQHFVQIGIEPFTYASQWFLTVFTAKFPLNAVFYIMDIFLLDGMDTIFQIALSLLFSSKQELLALDFEGVLKYFRVQMPKRYKNQENVQQLIQASSEMSLKRLKKHAKSYEIAKQKEKLLENPLARLQRENAKLTENNLRLDQENDDLARDLVASKIQLRAHLDQLEDKIDTLNRELIKSQNDCKNYLSTISDMDDERARLEVEVTQLKEVCRRELNRAEAESARDTAIITDYKKICSQLSKRLDDQVGLVVKFLNSSLDTLQDNESCKDRSCYCILKPKVVNFSKMLESTEDQRTTPSVPDCETATSTPANQATIQPVSLRQDSSDSDKSTQQPPVSTCGEAKALSIKSSDSSQSTSSSEIKIQQLTQQIDNLEVELACTKLALVEAECKCQQLTHDLSSGLAVKTTSSNSNSNNSSGGGLSGKFEFVKAAVTHRRSPGVTSNAFAKINNLISEKISNISQTNQNYFTSPEAAGTASSSATFIRSSDFSNGDGNKMNSATLPTDPLVTNVVCDNKGSPNTSAKPSSSLASNSRINDASNSNNAASSTAKSLINQVGNNQNRC